MGAAARATTPRRHVAKVQIMAMPDPSRVGQRVGDDRDLHPNSGVRTVVPNREAKRSSSGAPPAPRRPPPAPVVLSLSQCRRSAGGGRRRGGPGPPFRPGPRRLVIDVPQGRRLGGVGLTRARLRRNMRWLAGGSPRRWWRSCGSSPPTAEASPQVLERLLVLGGQAVAQAMKLGRLTAMSSLPGSSGGSKSGS